MSKAIRSVPICIVSVLVKCRTCTLSVLEKSKFCSLSVFHPFNGRRNLTETTAMLVEAALDVPPDSLMALQHKYNMQKIRRDRSFMSRLDAIRKVAAVL